MRTGRRVVGALVACAGIASVAACGSSSEGGATQHDAGSDGSASGGTSSGGSGGTSSGGTSSGGTSSGGTSSGGVAGVSGSGGSVLDASTDAAGGAAGSAGSGADAGPLGVGGCSADPPVGAPQAPDPPAYSGGTCPALPTTADAAGANNPITIKTSGNNRTFLLALPHNILPTEKLPIIFLWHWLGGSAKSFYDKGEVQAAVDAQRFIAVIPEADPSSLNVFKWPYSLIALPQQVQAELTFFDDMLSCVSQQFNVNKNCVSSAGVSAGALWTDQLVGQRSQYLSSFLSLSGGVGTPQNQTIKPWTKPVHPIPGMVLWGGPQDICVLQQFQVLSLTLEQNLTQDGSFFLECIHNCAHAEPPFEPPAGYSKYAGLWQFALDHPYWLPKGYSPYTSQGLPVSVPPWCGIGAGSATPRTGACPPPSCPI
ncbi:MAG: hypothetical protein H6717_36080 [Polyangiaceae bacterium]|nr:hypothetical protein [Polyangiaceae bacterium]